ncbi:MAG TPA: endonuclease/exonuclease/phosphatase family protein [Allocoleopsis sp.]
MSSIKVVSLNIEYCSNVSRGYWQYLTNLWKYILPHDKSAIWKISNVINTEEVHVATFTEMDGGGYRTKNLNYMNIISEITPLKNNVFYPVNRMWFNLGVRGNGIATVYDIVEAKNIKLEHDGFIGRITGENRYLSSSKINLNGQHITILTTQLALGKGSRLKELEHIKNIIQSHKGPIIFTGDLNTEYEDELKILDETGLIRVETPKTFPSWKPSRRIDYIFHSKDFDHIDSRVLERLKVSDHLPVITELKLK